MEIKQIVVKDSTIYGLGRDDNQMYRWDYSTAHWVPYWQTNQNIGKVPSDDPSGS